MDERDTQARHCPYCGVKFSAGTGFVQEFWVAQETVFYCWCGSCAWAGEIKTVTRVIGVEPAEGDEPPADLRELEYLFGKD